MSRIVCVGEGMLELTRDGEDWRLGYGGDTLNTAIHLARMGHAVGYFTAIGADPLSQEMKRRWHDEGLDVSRVLTHPERPAGLYAINTDAAGERTFTYWREASAAREIFALPGAGSAVADSEQADLLHFSLITLAILPPEHRGALLALAARVRARGGRVSFDGNYRARLWPDRGEAVRARDAALAVADIGLPTLDDEAALSGAEDAAHVAAHWQAHGCAEVVVKLGERGCRLADGAVVPPDARLQPLDTSGAGDAFDAGYLSGRLRGGSPDQAAREGHALAAWAIARRGAIPPRDPDAPYKLSSTGSPE
ncbi:MAG TPA: sugar kinase [Croceibacterium sp.]|nr:sugar kinase [Croceibacterium sp.]